jgi:integrase
MFDYSESGVTLAAILDTRRANKDGLYPVKVRVTFRRERKYYGTGKYLTEEVWEKLPASKSKLLIDLKNDIQTAADKVKRTVKELIRDDVFSFSSLEKRLGNATGDTVNTALTARISELSEKGKASTSEVYKYTLNSIIRFAGHKVKFQQVSTDWLQRYERHLLEEGKSYTTISMYMRALKAIINQAKEVGIVKPSSYPFGKGKYEIPQHEGRNIALSIADIGKIMKYECETRAQERSRDLWVFSYLCNGANIADIFKFRYSNIRGGDICFYRQKTLGKAKKKKLIQAVVTPEMQAIMDKWGNLNKAPDTYIFPLLQGNEPPAEERRLIKNTTRRINANMKHVGEKLGIGNVSTYTARHSYASVLKRSGANIAFISESLGHNDLKTTENYLASFEQEERVKNAALLTNF